MDASPAYWWRTFAIGRATDAGLGGTGSEIVTAGLLQVLPDPT